MKNNSCKTAIQTVIDEWKMLIIEGNIIGVIFMDLKKAFETINRDRLFRKMYQYGIRGKVHNWIKTYLSNRTQQVKINQVSKKIMTTHGVPQGSVLGPLLFTIYINDIVQNCPNICRIRLFADNTLIYVKGSGSEEVVKKLNIVLSILEKWMNTNKLKMNTNKTKYMVIKSIRKEFKKDIRLKCIDNTEIERVENMKYLGVIIDSKLRFEEYCNHMLKKLGKKINFLNRVGSEISVYARCVVYKSIVAPHFEYCATLIAAMNLAQRSKLQIAQNRAMRIILRCDRYTSVKRMLQALQFMLINQRMYYNACIFIYKILRGIIS